MTLRDYAEVLKKWWKTIAALAVVGLVAGGVLAVALPAKYEASSQLYVTIPTSDSAVSYTHLTLPTTPYV